MAKRRDADLETFSDDQLLQMRMCDLPVKIKGSPIEERIEQVYEELEERGLDFRPHFWLADEWYSPDGVPGVAIPFYLGHPRLRRLERRQMLEVEGGTKEWCMRILRHEVGHAIDTAYRLRRRKSYREIFGRVSQPYPDHYEPKPYSRSYVLHLEMWYAQAHPVEDFAETFAVWLRPGSRWKSRYKHWPALKKLEYVDAVMNEIVDYGLKPSVVSREHVDPLRTIRKTLAEHYTKKRDHYGIDHPTFYDRDLRRLFSDDPKFAKNPTAAAFLNQIRPELRRSIATWTGEYQYTIDQVLSEMVERCRELRLRVAHRKQDTKRDVTILVTIQTMNYLHQGHHRVAL